MVTFLFTSVLVLGLLAIAIYFWQKPANRSETIALPPLPEEQRGLFSDFRVNQLRPPTENQLSDKGPEVDAETFQEAIKAIKAFQESPNRNSTTKLLHIAALSDDAKNYGRAVELVLMFWRDGTLSDLSARELQTLFNSEYWVLSSRTRTSGAGFVLKETLSSANRELQSTNNPI
jgi:hypothetical protein